MLGGNRFTLFLPNKNEGKVHKVKQVKKPRRKWTLAERIIFIVCCIIIVIGILCIVYSDRYRILERHYRDCEVMPLNLSEEQKLEDFEYYYNAIVSNFPMLEEYKEGLGFDFEERKEYYEEMVKATTSDYEFFSVLMAISDDIPSFHTDIVFPRFEEYKTLGCYNMTPTLCNNKVYPASIYWQELLKSEYDKEYMRGVTYVGYKYINGEYVMIADTEAGGKGTKLLEVNGVDIHDYVFENQFSSVKKRYDVQHDRLYLTLFYVNNKLGEPVTLTLEDCDGNRYYREAFCEKEKSAGLYLNWAYGKTATTPSVLNQYVYHYIDETNDVGYIRIMALGRSWEEEIEGKLNEVSDCKSIIIDLRDNYGGVQEVAQKCIYPKLFSTDVTMKNRWYMIDSPDNKKIAWEDKLSFKFKLRFKKAGMGEVYATDKSEYLYTVRKYDYKGEAKEEKDVYVLINNFTGSAADGFVAALKKTSAVVIGENTNGEGLAKSFVCDYLPNSGLVFIYMFGKAFNEDGTDNSLYGTAPDIYAYITAEGYGKCNEMIFAGIDPYTYENRQKWDDVLNQAIEMIENKKISELLRKY